MQIVNFTQPVSDLNEFAQLMQTSRQSHRVISVSSDYFGSFQVIGPEFFVFQNGGFGKVYSEQRLANQVYVDQLAESLFCFYQTLGLSGPILRVTDDLTQKVAQKLHQIYKENPSQGKQSLLILFQREDDLYSPVYHSWTYLSLIQDIFSIKNNTFVFKEDQNTPNKSYEICLKSDSILKENGLKGFHEAGENVDKALVQWKQDYENLNKQTQNQDLKQISGVLTTAMDAIPAMTEKKRKIDMHVSIATKILQEIKKREIDKLQDFEDEIMKGSAISTSTKTEIQNYLNKENQDKNDVVRFLVILSQCCQDRRFVEQTLQQVNINPQDLAMLKKMLQTNKAPLQDIEKAGIMGLAKSVAMGSKSLIENFVFGKDKKRVLFNHVKSFIQAIQNGVPLQHTEVYFNTVTGQKTSTFLYLPQKVVVYACGGGTFFDYEQIQSLTEELNKSEKKIQLLYGADTIYSPNEFLTQLKQRYNS